MTIHDLLTQRFGFEQFRPGQEEAITALLEHKRLLCIQPTGHGKSLIYQLPALLFDGLTLVISPLLALMRDQIGQLNQRFQIPAVSINSDQTDEENNSAMFVARQGKARILFIAPEKLDNLEIYDFLSNLHVALVVIDEAHCISTWGHDFRPAYRQIVRAVSDFAATNSDLHVLGLTATANRRTEKDIAAQLRGHGGPPVTTLRLSMDRPNIRLSVLPANGLAEKLTHLAALLNRLEGTSILYCATRDHTEIVAGYLQEKGLPVAAYHAGMPPDVKRELQHDFMNGRHQAIAATNALGMGIDKADIRNIIHVDLPGSITAYYQEVGRAGRDGLPAQGILLYDGRDRRIQDHFIRSAQPNRADFLQILSQIQPDLQGQWPNLTQIKLRSGLHPTRVTVIMAELVEQGFVSKQRIGGRQVYVLEKQEGEPDLVRYERQVEVRNNELEALLSYADGEASCLMQTLRLALGDLQAPPCGRCSRCRPQDFEFSNESAVQAQNWLDQRDVPIAPSRRPPLSPGLAVLNGEQRSPLFVRFMHQRANPEGELSQELLQRLFSALAKLQEEHRFGALIPIPSRTWQQRETAAEKLARYLGIKSFPDLLAWRELPEARQGELLNNDQRRFNVQGKMHLTGPLIRHGAPQPKTAILLLDDYTGSGATIKEAVRTLRTDGGFSAAIVPFTIASVRWRLGARGMI